MMDEMVKAMAKKVTVTAEYEDGVTVTWEAVPGPYDTSFILEAGYTQDGYEREGIYPYTLSNKPRFLSSTHSWRWYMPGVNMMNVSLKYPDEEEEVTEETTVEDDN